MIPYEIIVPSACRPHLLEPTLRSLLTSVDQPPARILVHDDAAWPERKGEVRRLLDRLMSERVIPDGIAVLCEEADPPRCHGPALAWLLGQVRTEYVLYTQDDFAAIRPIPVMKALAVLDRNGLHQIRFNKRVTMDKKGPEGQEFRKVEVQYPCGGLPCGVVTLCVADHWYFQTGLWRVARIKPFVDAWMAYDPVRLREHCEWKLNWAMDGLGEGEVVVLGACPAWLDPTDPAVRDVYLRTYIWGQIGEEPYVKHIGDKPDDWAAYIIRDGRWSGRKAAQAKDYSSEGH